MCAQVDNKYMVDKKKLQLVLFSLKFPHMCTHLWYNNLQLYYVCCSDTRL